MRIKKKVLKMGSLDPFIMREAYAEQINFVGEHS